MGVGPRRRLHREPVLGIEPWPKQEKNRKLRALPSDFSSFSSALGHYLNDQYFGMCCLLDHYCVNDFERNHCQIKVGPQSEAIRVYRFEFGFLTLLVVLVLQPGVLSTWISIPLLFLWLMSRGIRSAIKDTFGGMRMAFDTGGKVFGFFTFGSAINYGLACLIATMIEWSEQAIQFSAYIPS